MYPEKMENILQGARSATSPRPLFLFSRKRPLLFILVFFHPPSLPSSFPPRFYFNSHCFFLPHDAQTRVHSGNRRKALVALPFFPILLPYCLSRYSRVESESGSQLVFSQSWLIKPFFFTSPWIRYTGLFNYEEFIREESSFYYLTRFSLSSSLILSSFDNGLNSLVPGSNHLTMILSYFFSTSIFLVQIGCNAYAKCTQTCSTNRFARVKDRVSLQPRDWFDI